MPSCKSSKFLRNYAISVWRNVYVYATYITSTQNNALLAFLKDFITQYNKDYFQVSSMYLSIILHNAIPCQVPTVLVWQQHKCCGYLALWNNIHNSWLYEYNSCMSLACCSNTVISKIVLHFYCIARTRLLLKLTLSSSLGREWTGIGCHGISGCHNCLSLGGYSPDRNV